MATTAIDFSDLVTASRCSLRHLRLAPLQSISRIWAGRWSSRAVVQEHPADRVPRFRRFWTSC